MCEKRLPIVHDPAANSPCDQLLVFESVDGWESDEEQEGEAQGTSRETEQR